MSSNRPLPDTPAPGATMESCEGGSDGAAGADRSHPHTASALAAAAASHPHVAARRAQSTAGRAAARASAVIASANACALGHRSAGSFSSARSTAASSAGEMLRRCRLGGTGSSVTSLATIACDGRAGERRLADQHLVRHRAERVDVGAMPDALVAHRLLGRHVLRRAERQACLRHALAARVLHGERDPEVRHERGTVVQQDVLGLDVAVHDAMPMRVLQRRRHLGGDADRVVDRQLLLAIEPRAQRLAVDEGHHVEQLSRRVSRVEQRQDVRMLQAGRDLDLLEEALGADHRRQLGVQHLHRHLAVMARVRREIDGRHPAAAELALDRVSVGQRPFQRFVHGGQTEEGGSHRRGGTARAARFDSRCAAPAQVARAHGAIGRRRTGLRHAPPAFVSSSSAPPRQNGSSQALHRRGRSGARRRARDAEARRRRDDPRLPRPVGSDGGRVLQRRLLDDGRVALVQHLLLPPRAADAAARARRPLRRSSAGRARDRRAGRPTDRTGERGTGRGDHQQCEPLAARGVRRHHRLARRARSSARRVRSRSSSRRSTRRGG